MKKVGRELSTIEEELAKETPPSRDEVGLTDQLKNLQVNICN